MNYFDPTGESALALPALGPVLLIGGGVLALCYIDPSCRERLRDLMEKLFRPPELCPETPPWDDTTEARGHGERKQQRKNPGRPKAKDNQTGQKNPPPTPTPAPKPWKEPEVIPKGKKKYQ